MSWLYLPEQAADCSRRSTCSDIERFATSNESRTASKSSKPASKTVCLTTHRSGMTFGHSTGDPGVDAWILSLRDSRASRLVLPDKSDVTTTTEICGPTPCEFFAKFDHDTRCLKMSQGLLFPATSAASSKDWPRAGLMLNGTVYRRAHMVPIFLATEYGSLPRLPRPVACDGKGSGRIRWERIRGGGMNLRDWFNWKYAMVYPPVRVNEYLMGWPIGWTDLRPLATDKFRSWLRSHGDC